MHRFIDDACTLCCFSCNFNVLARRIRSFVEPAVYVKIENTRCVELAFSLFASFDHKQKVYSYQYRQSISEITA